MKLRPSLGRQAIVTHSLALNVVSSPLRHLLEHKLDLRGIDQAIAQKQLHAVAVTAFGYESGQAVTFYQGGRSIDAWLRHRRIGVPTSLKVEHLLASSAIPLLFAPVKIGDEYFGDGAVRQSAAALGVQTLAAFRDVEVIYAPAAATEGKSWQRGR